MTEEKQGEQRYDPAFQWAVRDAWARGEFASEQKLADAFGISHKTLGRWRNAAKPDGIAWEEVRRRYAEVKVDIDAQTFGETAIEMSFRQVQFAKAIQSRGMAYLSGQVYKLADGSTLRLPLTAPESFGEAVSGVLAAMKFERHARGEPDIRVEYLHRIGEALRHAFDEFLEQRGLDGDEEAQLFTALLGKALEEALGPEGRSLGIE